MSDRQHATAVYSLGWLVAAGAVGALMAFLLIFPEAGRLLGPLTYGRWATVHLDAELYGWCALPLVGLLFRMYDVSTAAARWTLRAWTLALLVGCASWLAGITGGKLFMEWTGTARIAFPVALVLLWLVLLIAFFQNGRGSGAVLMTVRIALLIALAPIGPLMYWAADPALFPPINPDSGGATGGSLLGSTLAVVGILVACPLILNLPATGNRARRVGAASALLALHFGWFFALDHGHHSHHEPNQLWALFSLAAWWPLLIWYWRGFTWPAATRLWLRALAAWAATLLVTALFTFLPGVLEAWKFTNALVAHSHIAMAGMLTSLNMLILVSLGGPRGLDRPVLFWLWHGGAVLLVASLLSLGVLESESQSVLFRSEPAADACYALRLAGGGLMLAAAVGWWVGAWRSKT